MLREAYLDTIETKTGKNLNEFIALAKEKGYNNPLRKQASLWPDWGNNGGANQQWQLPPVS